MNLKLIIGNKSFFKIKKIKNTDLFNSIEIILNYRKGKKLNISCRFRNVSNMDKLLELVTDVTHSKNIFSQFKGFWCFYYEFKEP